MAAGGLASLALGLLNYALVAKRWLGTMDSQPATASDKT